MKSNQSSQKPFEGTDSTVFATNFWPSKMHGVVSPFLQNKEIRVNHMKNIWLGSLGGLALCATGLFVMALDNGQTTEMAPNHASVAELPQPQKLDSTSEANKTELSKDPFGSHSMAKTLEDQLVKAFDQPQDTGLFGMPQGFLDQLSDESLGAELIADEDSLADAVQTPGESALGGGAGGLTPVFDSEGNEILGILVFGSAGNQIASVGSGGGSFRASLPGFAGQNPGGPVGVSGSGGRSTGYPVYVPVYVPEPASAALVLAGTFALAHRRRRMAH